MKKLTALLGVLTLLSATPAQANETLRVTIIGIDCKECAPPIVRALKEVPGVRNATLDWKSGIATVEVPDGFDKTRIRKAVDVIGYDAVFEGEVRKEFATLPADVIAKLDILSYDGKTKVDLKSIPVPGKITILDYWAEWCSPCHFLEKRLQHLMNANGNMALRRVDVGKWNNAAASQATKEFRLEALPYVRVYDANGRFAGDVTGGSWDELLKVLETARKRA